MPPLPTRVPTSKPVMNAEKQLAFGGTALRAGGEHGGPRRAAPMEYRFDVRVVVVEAMGERAVYERGRHWGCMASCKHACRPVATPRAHHSMNRNRGRLVQCAEAHTEPVDETLPGCVEDFGRIFAVTVVDHETGNRIGVGRRVHENGFPFERTGQCGSINSPAHATVA